MIKTSKLMHYVVYKYNLRVVYPNSEFFLGTIPIHSGINGGILYFLIKLYSRAKCTKKYSQNVEKNIKRKKVYKGQQRKYYINFGPTLFYFLM